MATLPYADNPARLEECRRAIAAAPGIHLRAIQRELGYSLGMTQDIVARLLDGGEIHAVSQSGRKCFFTTEPDELQAWLHQHPKALQLLRHVQDPCTINDAAQALGWPRQTVAFNADELESRGLLASQREGRKRILRVVTRTRRKK